MSMLFKRIKDWATSITAFRVGDVIPVDGPDGTAKMGKDDLLASAVEEDADVLYSRITPTTTKNDYYLDSNGNEQASLGINIDDYDVSIIDMVYIAARIGAIAYIWFYDSSNNRLSGYVGNSVAGINFHKHILVPQNAVKMRVSYTTTYPIFVFTYSALLLCTEENALESFEAPLGVKQTQVKQRCYLDNNGVEKYATTTNIADFDVSDVEIVHVIARVGPIAYIWFYDSSNNRLSGYAGNSVAGINFDKHILVPQNAVKMRLSYTFNFPRLVFNAVKSSIYESSYFSNNGLVEYDDKNGYYLDSNGAEQGNAVTSIASYIIGDAKWFYIEARIGYIGYIWFYDNAGNAISSIVGNSDAGVNFKKIVNVPVGAFAVRITYTTSYGIKLLSGKFADKVLDAEKIGIFNGRKIAFIGDSITYGYSATNYKGYVDMIAQETGATCVNLGYPSSCIANNTTNGESSHRFVTRATSADLAGADLVVVFGGTNDFSYDSKPIGDLFNVETITPSGRIGDKKMVAVTDTDTFAGALHDLITTIQANAPTHCKIMFITPLKRGRYMSGRPTAYESNPNGDFLKDFASAINEVCSFYSVPVLDLYALGINPLSGLESDLFADTLHPNDAGHKILAEIISKFIEENITLIR